MCRFAHAWRCASEAKAPSIGDVGSSELRSTSAQVVQLEPSQLDSYVKDGAMMRVKKNSLGTSRHPN
jgi:hypothetical protein